MTNLEKRLVKSLIVGHRLSIYTRLQVDKLIEKTGSQESMEADLILEALRSFGELTFPLAALVGGDNAKELAIMIFDMAIEEEKIVEFIEKYYIANTLKPGSAPF